MGGSRAPQLPLGNDTHRAARHLWPNLREDGPWIDLLLVPNHLGVFWQIVFAAAAAVVDAQNEALDPSGAQVTELLAEILRRPEADDLEQPSAIGIVPVNELEVGEGERASDVDGMRFANQVPVPCDAGEFSSETLLELAVVSDELPARGDGVARSQDEGRQVRTPSHGAPSNELEFMTPREPRHERGKRASVHLGMVKEGERARDVQRDTNGLPADGSGDPGDAEAITHRPPLVVRECFDVANQAQ